MTQVLINGPAQANRNPVVGWHNLLTAGSVSVSSQADGFTAANAFDNVATDYWQPSTGGANWIEVSLPVATKCDYVGIARHTLGSDNAAFRIRYDSGGGWSDAFPATTVADDGVILVLFEAVTADRFRLEYTSSAKPLIGALAFGERLQMETGIFAGYTPEGLNRETTLYNARTESGAFLPTTVLRQGTQSSIDITHLSAGFAHQRVAPFMRHAEVGHPFFWAWSPIDYPDSVVWARASGTPRCTPMQPGGPAERGYWALSCAIRGVLL